MRPYDREEFDYRRWAKQRYGVIHRREMLERGFSKDKIARMSRRGDLTPIHPQVFVVAGAAETWEQTVYDSG